MRNLYRCLCEISVRIGIYKLELWRSFRGNSSAQWKCRRIFLARGKDKNPPMVGRAKVSSKADKFLRTSSNLRWSKILGSKSSKQQRSILAGNPNSHRQPCGRLQLGEMYTYTGPTSWALQELAFRILTTNTTIISKRQKGDSGERSLWADKLSRNLSTQFKGATQRAPEWGRPNSRLTNIREKSVVELLGALSLKGKTACRSAPV